MFAAIACALPSKTAVWPPVASAVIASPTPPETAVLPPPDTEALKLHPSLALMLLQAGEDGPGRLWLPLPCPRSRAGRCQGFCVFYL
jgi:hypothetical protein